MGRPTVRLFLALTLWQLSPLAYCDPGSGKALTVARLFEAKGTAMREVAREIAELHEDNEIYGLDFNPDGTYLATTATIGQKVNIWDWQNRRIVRTLIKPDRTGQAVIGNVLQYNPDGELLAACHGRANEADHYSVVTVWGASTGKVVRSIGESLPGACSAIAFTPDGRLLMRIMERLGPGGQLIVQEIATWQSIWEVSVLPLYPTTLAISPDGKFVALGGNTGGPGIPHKGQIVIVDIQRRAMVRTIDAFPVDHGRLEQIAWNPDGVHIAAGAAGVPLGGDEALKIFDVRTGEEVAGEPASEGARVYAIRYTPDGKYFIESGIGKTIRIWEGQHRDLLQEVPGQAASIAVSRDGRYVAMGGDRKILVFEMKKTRP